MFRNRFVAALSGLALLSITACAPPGMSNEKVGLLWPRSDQTLGQAGQREIEGLLRRLGYFRGKVDGAITRDTRAAIASYQNSIGAPTRPFISETLLVSLRQTAGVAAPLRKVAPAKTTAKRTTTTVKPNVTKPAATGGGSTGSVSGGGGGGGGAWG